MPDIGSATRAALAALLLVAVPGCGSEEAGWGVVVPGPEGGNRAYLALPPGDGPYPGLLLLPEAGSRQARTRREADRFARERLVTLALEPGDAEGSGGLAQAPDPARADLALQAAFDWLRAHPRVGGRRVAILARGGRADAALRLAIREPDLTSAVLHAPQRIPEGIRLEAIRASLLGIFVDGSPELPTQRVHQLHRRLRELGKDADLYIYPEAGPGFMNPDDAGYRAGAARDANRKTIEYLRDRLYRRD
jgi:carboxymethylenebutenolidase